MSQGMQLAAAAPPPSSAAESQARQQAPPLLTVQRPATYDAGVLADDDDGMAIDNLEGDKSLCTPG